MSPSTASRNHFSLTLQSLTNTHYYVPVEIPFLPLVRDAEHRTSRCNSGKRPQSSQGQRHTKKTTKHPAPPSGKVPRGDQGQLLVLPKPTVGAAVGRVMGGDGWKRPTAAGQAKQQGFGGETSKASVWGQGRGGKGITTSPRRQCRGCRPVPDQIPQRETQGHVPKAGGGLEGGMRRHTHTHTHHTPPRAERVPDREPLPDPAGGPARAA